MTTLLTTTKLDKVEVTIGKVATAAKAVDKLIDEEPVTQPPTPRTVALRRHIATLKKIGAELEALWS